MQPQSLDSFFAWRIRAFPLPRPRQASSSKHGNHRPHQPRKQYLCAPRRIAITTSLTVQQEVSKEINGTNGTSGVDHAGSLPKQRSPYDYGGNPLAHVATNDPTLRLPAFGGEFQPGLYRAPKKNFANPAPLGLSAFALTTFVLSLINMGTLGIGEPNLVVAIAYGYGGLVQLLAGMWEMAVGNTFGATALSSYGGFWISFAIILTPGGFQIASTLEAESPDPFLNSFGLYLMVGLPIAATTRSCR